MPLNIPSPSSKGKKKRKRLALKGAERAVDEILAERHEDNKGVVALSRAEKRRKDAREIILAIMT
jgi:hypothetical protein